MDVLEHLINTKIQYNSCKRHATDNRRTPGRGIFCAVHADSIYRGLAAITSQWRDITEMAVKKVEACLRWPPACDDESLGAVGRCYEAVQ
jgi:hypothetical protein